jgi:hypothetical protein
LGGHGKYRTKNLSLMLIHFRHYDRNCSAYIVYEPSQIKNTVVVYVLDQNTELGYEVIFTKKEQSHWDTTAGIKAKYPVTYHDLCQKLSEAFPGNSFSCEQLNKVELNKNSKFVL